MATKAGEVFYDVRANFAQFDRDLFQVQQRVDRSLGRSLGRVGSNLSRVGKTLTRNLTLPLAGVGFAAFRASGDFESAFAGVRKTVEATEPEFAALRKGILDMSKEIPAAATEIAAVGEAAGQLGISKDAILGFTRVMVDLGNSTNLSATEAASSLARLANITQLPQDQFDRLGSTIVALGNNLATTEAEITEMGLRIAGAGKQVGLSQAQILSFAGALSSVGVRAEAGGSAISRVFLTLQKSVADGGDQLAGFARVAGVSAEEFARAFRADAAGATVAFIEGLERLRAGGENVAGTLQELELGELRVRDALLRASGAGDLFRESLALGNTAWEENNALTEEAAKRYETAQSRLAIMRNRIVATGISIGDKLTPLVLKLVDGIAGLVEGFDRLSPVTQKFILVGAGIAAALGPGLRIIGSLTTGIGSLTTGIGGLVTKFAAAGSAASSAAGLIPKFGAALGALGISPVGLAITGAAIAVGFLISKMAGGKTAADNFAESLDRVKESSDALADAELRVEQAELNLPEARRVERIAERQLQRAKEDGKSRRELLQLERALAQATIDRKRAELELASARKTADASRAEAAQDLRDNREDLNREALELAEPLKFRVGLDEASGGLTDHATRFLLTEAGDQVRQLAQDFVAAGGSIQTFSQLQAFKDLPEDIRNLVEALAFEGLKERSPRAIKAAERAIEGLGQTIRGQIPETVETTIISELAGVINGRKTNFDLVEQRLEAIKDLDPTIRKEILAALRTDIDARIRVQAPTIRFGVERGGGGGVTLTPAQIRGIQYFHSGGVVQGPLGADVLALLRAGETVRTAQQERSLGSRGGITVYQTITGASAQQIADLSAAGIRRVIREEIADEAFHSQRMQRMRR